jgi:hypothetical protein
VRTHPEAPSAPQVLCRVPGAARAAVLSDRLLGVVRLDAQLLTTPGPDEAVGLIVRWRSDGSYYLTRLSSDTNTVRFYRYDRGEVTLLASHTLPVAVSRWHALTVHARGPELVAILNGEAVLRVADETVPRGGVALWGSDRSGGCFDDVLLAAPDLGG